MTGRWFGPSGLCGCCESPCRCVSDPSIVARQFGRTPTAKLVITGAPATLNLRGSARLGLGSDALISEYQITGFDSLNGTFFRALPKTLFGCIDETLPTGGFTGAGGSVSIKRDRYLVPLNATQQDCDNASFVDTRTIAASASTSFGRAQEWPLFVPLPTNTYFFLTRLLYGLISDPISIFAIALTGCEFNYEFNKDGNDPVYTISPGTNSYTGKIMLTSNIDSQGLCSPTPSSIELANYTISIEDL